MRSIVSISVLECAFESRCVWVGLVRTATSPFGESVFESQLGDHADLGRVGERGSLVEHHLIDDIGTVSR